MSADRERIRGILSYHTIAAPLWAPVGRRLAYVTTFPEFEPSRYRSTLWVVDLAGGQSRALVEQAEGASVPFAWSPDGASIACVLKAGEGQELRIVPVDGGEAHTLPVPEGVHGPILSDEFFATLEWSPDGTRLLYAAQEPAPEHAPDPAVDPRNDGEGYGEIQRVRLWVRDRTGANPPRPISSPGYHSGAARWSPDGSRIVFVSNRSGREEGLRHNWRQPFDLWTVAPDGGSEALLLRGPGPNLFPGWRPDGEQIAFLAGDRFGPHADVLNVHVVNADGRGRRALSAALDRCPDRLSAQAWLDSAGLALTFDDGARNVVKRVGLDGRVEDLRAPNHRDARPWEEAAGEARRPYIEHAAARPGGAELAWVAQGPNDPPEVQVVSLARGAVWQSAHNEAVRADGHRTQVETYPAAGGGVDHEVLVTRPARAAWGAPIILNPHGGPHSRSTLAYTPEWQVYAAHGFVVVAPNYRGSAGYGRAFLDGDRLDLGGADFSDCLAALDRALAEERQGAPAAAASWRQFIVGSSYGGFLTAWAVGHATRFRAAVAINAVVNAESLFGQTDIPGWVRWEFGGAPQDARAAIRAGSPLTHVGPHVTTPTLVLHSEADRRVPLAQGLELVRALREAGVPTQFVRYPREGHRIHEPAHRVDVLARVIEWFQTYGA